jgi:hypothetical protein
MNGIVMTNDTRVFYAMYLDSLTGEMKPVGRAGTGAMRDFG